MGNNGCLGSRRNTFKNQEQRSEQSETSAGIKAYTISETSSNLKNERYRPLKLHTRPETAFKHKQIRSRLIEKKKKNQ